MFNMFSDKFGIYFEDKKRKKIVEKEKLKI